MKILYFGTICNLSNYENIIKQCKSKPTVATIVFETALVEGLLKNDAEIEIHSFPMIPTFPNSPLLYFGGDSEKLPLGLNCRWLRTLNLPFAKQLTRRYDAKRIIKQWAEKNGNNGIILTYSIPPFMVKEVLKYSKKYNLKSVAIIPDLLKDMYVNENQRSFTTKIKNYYLKSALKVQNEYEGYIYLTEAMHKEVAPNKPYIVMEGIADIKDVDEKNIKKAEPRAIMYAGMLFEKYGIFNLIDAFENIDDEKTELWLFGDGNAVEKIKKRAESNPRIRFFGKVERDEILLKEKQAALLVNPRDPKEEFTKYSFPSKTIEYMLSGTPLLSTKLQGIPEEYFEHMFSIESNDIKDLTEAMNNILSQSERELSELGKQAKLFIINKKNSKEQAKHVLDFIEEV